MSQVIDLREDSDSDGDGEWRNSTNTASVPSLPLSRKRPRDNEELFNDAHPRSEIGPGNKTATGSADFVVDLELADEVKRKRRGIVKSARSVKNDAAGEFAQIRKGAHATEEEFGNGDAQVADHCKSHKGLAEVAAASHPMNSDSKQTNRDDGSAKKHSQKISTSKAPPKTSGRRCRVSIWENRLSELAEYRKIYGHCNVPQRSSEYTKLANWVSAQRRNHRKHVKGIPSQITLPRIQALESIGFEWGDWATAWEDRLSELADYHKIHGHCNVPRSYSENCKLGEWVTTQKSQYRLHEEGKKSHMTILRIRALESLGFEWGISVTTWEDRLSELADYRKIHGHCSVPKNYSENNNLAKWVKKQRGQYSLHLKGKPSQITLPRIQALETLGFEWRPRINCRKGPRVDETDLDGLPSELAAKPSLYSDKPAAMSLSPDNSASRPSWEDRFSELADYRKVHENCNVPYNYSENIKLANWVTYQRYQYKLRREGKISQITLPRIQALESLGFEWRPSISRRKGPPKKPSLDDDDDATDVCERAIEAPEHRPLRSHKKIAVIEKSAAIKSTSLSKANNPTGKAKSTSTSPKFEPITLRSEKAGEAQYKMDLDGSPLELASKPSLYSDRHATKSLSPDKPDIVGSRMESNTRKDALQATTLTGLAHRKKRIISFSHALLAASPPENEFLVATMKPANSRESANSQLETAPCNEKILRITGYH
jgi:hypothetical protein